MLIDAVRAGGKEEDEAIAFLIRNEYGKVENMIVKRNGSIADAEDVFQEAVSVLILNIRKGVFKGESAVATYLFAICKGMWYKRFKKYMREMGVKDAWIVPYRDGERVEIKDVLEGVVSDKPAGTAN